MTNTVVIIPVNSDARPTSYSYSFQTEHGVGIDMTVKTRDEGIAQKVADDITGQLKWKRVPKSEEIATALVPFMIAVGLIMLGAMIWFGVVMLDYIGWLPHFAYTTTYGDTYRMDSYESINHVVKLYIKGALIAWLPLSVLGMIANHYGVKQEN